MRLGDLDALKSDLKQYFSDGTLESVSAKLAFNMILRKIDEAPTVDTFTFDDMKKGINVGYKAGRLSEKWERPQGAWIDYDNTFYKCPDCGYLLEKCCPQCQNKVILPKGGAE